MGLSSLMSGAPETILLYHARGAGIPPFLPALRPSFLRVLLKIRYFFRGRGRVKIKSGAYMIICEHFYFHPNEEIGKKDNFLEAPLSRGHPRRSSIAFKT